MSCKVVSEIEDRIFRGLLEMCVGPYYSNCGLWLTASASPGRFQKQGISSLPSSF